MGTTSEKLNYLNQTKQLIRSFLVSQGVQVGINDTFRSYVSKLNQTLKRLGSKSITSNGTFYPTSDNLDGFDEVVVNVPSSVVVNITGGSGAPTSNTIRICDLINKLIKNNTLTEDDYNDENVEIMLEALDQLVVDGEDTTLEEDIENEE